MGKNSFGSFHHNVIENLGIVGYTTGTRPSSLIGWDDPTDWEARLQFDTKVIQSVLPTIQKLTGLGGGDNAER